MKEEIKELERLIEIYKSNSIQDNYSEIILQLNECTQKNLGLYLPCKESGDGYDIKTLTSEDGGKYLIACTSDSDKEDGVSFIFLTLKEIFEYAVMTSMCSGVCLNHDNNESQVVLNKEYCQKLLNSLERSKQVKK